MGVGGKSHSEVGQIPYVKFRLRDFSTAPMFIDSMNANTDRADKARLITTFGEGQFVRHIDGRYELIGGTAEDHADARDWCSLFALDVVFTRAARVVQPIGFAVEFPAHCAA
jgi:hypothetical protein